ncbi:MAG: FAD-dependent oxidoreductase, partial [Armatimonadota bacterium]
GLEMEGNDIKVNQQMMTNIPGVFAAGDVATYPGKIKLIATGVAEAAIAVNQAKVFIDPTARLQPAFSTTVGIAPRQ